MLLEYYKNKLGIDSMPSFLRKYKDSLCLMRLKKICYLCGMDYASTDIYNFKEPITRYDHSLTTALLTYKLTHNKIKTLAALFHDVGTPCFSHAIDYMNKDYLYQESTEEFNEVILRNDKYLNKLLKEDYLNIDDIINFKKYSVVDIERPKLCSDRLDGIILTSIAWTKNITKEEIDKIIDNLVVYNNKKESEIGFINYEAAELVLKKSNLIDEYCHSIEDHYMMELAASICRTAISKRYIAYGQLYTLDEEELINYLKQIDDLDLNKKFNIFENIKKDEINNVNIPYVKKRNLNPLYKNRRITKI